MIEIRDLRKQYGETIALRGISTMIPKGEIVGLLGPNGAGKTTTMKILVGYLLPTAGTATVNGWDVIQHPREVQKRVGYLPENAPLYGDMLVQEYLQFAAEMRELEMRTARSRIGVAVEECGIGNVLTRPIGQLSKGYRQRVGLAAALLHDPEILILDEPTNGLDPNQIVEVRKLIRRMGATKTIIVSTHILPEVEATCDRAVIIIDGLIRADGTLRDLTRSRRTVVSLAAPEPGVARELLADLEGVSSVDMIDEDDRWTTWRLDLEDGHDVAEPLAEELRRKNWPIRELRRDDATLEQVFRTLTETAAEVTA